MKHINVAHLGLQDEVKSSRFKVRRAKSEDNLADIGTKALSNRFIRKHAISMECADVQENLRSGDVVGWRIRARRSEENVIGVNWWPCQTAATAAAAVVRAPESL